jgi:hypothetical protein
MKYRGVAVAAICIAAWFSSWAQPGASDGYIAVVEHSDRMKVGERIILANLRAGQPIVVWPGGNAEPTQRAFQDEEAVVLVFVARLTGGTETFYANTRTKRFTLVEATLSQAMEPRFRPMVTQGSLRPQ